jgi:hypothetical protein
MTIANDLRTEVARILARYTGKPFDAIAPVRVAHIRAMDDYIERAEEAKANCTCEAARPAYRIPTERTDAAPYAAMEQARIDRLLFDGAA